jgi:hypothetical protein
MQMQPLFGLQSLLKIASEGYTWIAFLLHFLVTFNIVWLVSRPERCNPFRSYLYSLVVIEALLELALTWALRTGWLTESDQVLGIAELRRWAILVQCVAYTIGFISTFFRTAKQVDEERRESGVTRQEIERLLDERIPLAHSKESRMVASMNDTKDDSKGDPMPDEYRAWRPRTGETTNVPERDHYHDVEATTYGYPNSNVWARHAAEARSVANANAPLRNSITPTNRPEPIETQHFDSFYPRPAEHLSHMYHRRSDPFTESLYRDQRQDLYWERNYANHTVTPLYGKSPNHPLQDATGTRTARHAMEMDSAASPRVATLTRPVMEDIDRALPDNMESPPDSGESRPGHADMTNEPLPMLEEVSTSKRSAEGPPPDEPASKRATVSTQSRE